MILTIPTTLLTRHHLSGLSRPSLLELGERAQE